MTLQKSIIDNILPIVYFISFICEKTHASLKLLSLWETLDGRGFC